jgi:hypothetical protein
MVHALWNSMGWWFAWTLVAIGHIFIVSKRQAPRVGPLSIGGCM